MEEKFLLDSNSFITPYRQYYAFDLVPSYWQELSKPFNLQRLVLLDVVKDEINASKDELTEWLNKQTKIVIYNHKSEEIVNKYQEVMQYVQTCGFYTERALRNWSLMSVADPWLVAVAAVNHYTIITSEVPAGSLSIKNPTGNPKIPDVAKKFGVKTNNLFYMMRQLGMKI